MKVFVYILIALMACGTVFAEDSIKDIGSKVEIAKNNPWGVIPIYSDSSVSRVGFFHAARIDSGGFSIYYDGEKIKSVIEGVSKVNKPFFMWNIVLLILSIVMMLRSNILLHVHDRVIDAIFLIRLSMISTIVSAIVAIFISINMAVITCISEVFLLVAYLRLSYNLRGKIVNALSSSCFYASVIVVLCMSF
jgi:hypothetical protein